MYVLFFGRRSVYFFLWFLCCPCHLALSLSLFFLAVSLLAFFFSFLVFQFRFLFVIFVRHVLCVLGYVGWFVSFCFWLATSHCSGIWLLVCLPPPPFPFSSPRLSSYMELLLVFSCPRSSFLFATCGFLFTFVCLLCRVLMSWGWCSRGVVVLCLRLSMSSLSAVLLHRREVLPHMSILLLSLCLFVLLLLVGRSGVCGARAHHA